MYQHEYQYRVRYADTDQMGYVYYGNYARLYEIGRVEALRSLGFSYKAMEESGVMMPVYENTSKYIAPALYDDLLTIRTTIKTIPAARVVFHYEILNSKGVLVHKGETTLVFVKMENNRLTTAPKELLERLSAFFA
ncbi:MULTISPECIES: thioesterase family protein [unclassified Arcicella]|uniref:acyl-CoA thioesterase n=1 Tax=unclassified Arcicella TaxID=2644986 RepID=UPI0028542B5D|nr:MULTISPECIES: thioesterase family protein [unclassified Arcicella]MDR6562648.1 acyl-CoA thioester hydrolase [Arcicella sp. BE51]MDR6812735.1 acyl-CoA thioester hydrolase [Arcicella sp. BE140]MDR6824047.1 acyl-CoA thioester hydrolase [Arcicella sp. BE139]